MSVVPLDTMVIQVMGTLDEKFLALLVWDVMAETVGLLVFQA